MVKKEGVTKSGDVYQIGAALYEMLVGLPPFYNADMKTLMRNIEKGNLNIPEYLSEESKNCLTKLLNHDPTMRPTWEEVMKDPFFASIDWEALEKKELSPP